MIIIRIKVYVRKTTPICLINRSRNVRHFGRNIISILDNLYDNYIQKYYNAAATIENFIIRPYGGVHRRPGTYYVGEVKTSSKKTRLIPFEYSTTQAYIIELGDQYMRFYMDNGQITESGSAVEIATPYLEAELFDVQYAQSADTLYLAHPNHAPRKLVRNSHTDWDLSDYLDCMECFITSFYTANCCRIILEKSK